VRTELDGLASLPRGSVLYWEFGHFVVFDRMRSNGIDIVDPDTGPRFVPRAEVGRAFTGIALVLEPGANFMPGGIRERGRRKRLSWLRPLLGHVWPIIIASAVIQAVSLAVPVFTAFVVERVLPRADLDLLAISGFSLVTVLAVHLLAGLLRTQALVHLRTAADHELATRFLEHMVALPLTFFQRRTAGDLALRLGSNAMVREIVTASTLSSLLDGILVLGYLSLLFVLSPLVAAVAMTIALLQILLLLAVRRSQRLLLARELSAQSKLQGAQIELLSGLQTLKAMGLEGKAVEQWSNLFVDVLHASLARGRLLGTFEALHGTLKVGGPIAVLWAGAWLAASGRLGVGAMLATTSLASGFLAPVANLIAAALQLQMLGTYLERIEDVLDAPPEQPPAEQRAWPVLSGSVALEAVGFRHSAHGCDVLARVTAHIEPGQLVAIVGRSGSGKSTLASLLVGLLVPTSGRVLFDGRDIRELDLRALRRQIGVVTQATRLFASTIRHNIALGDPMTPLAQVERAARLACIHDDIAAMPLGYDTPVGEDGSSLSGGQRQRIALARALLHEPKLLLLDEATSALDAVTEARVHEGLERLAMTRIVIAHKLSTIRSADQILVVEGGAIVERGRHEGLLATGVVYRALLAAQQFGNLDELTCSLPANASASTSSSLGFTTQQHLVASLGKS
jgi:ABC-type bacteriocin/lantibiotic exporter with double-glycine peptidase domain